MNPSRPLTASRITPFPSSPKLLCRRKGKQDRKMNELRVRERAFDAEIARSSTELADEKAMQCKASTESDNEGNGEPAT